MITTLQASMGGVDWPKMIAAEYLPMPGIAVRTFIASSSGIVASLPQGDRVGCNVLCRLHEPLCPVPEHRLLPEDGGVECGDLFSPGPEDHLFFVKRDRGAEVFKHPVHHLFAPLYRCHLEEDREDNAAKDIIEEADPHAGQVGSDFFQDRIILCEPVEPGEVFICPETGTDQIPEIVLVFFCEGRCSICLNGDPVFL